MIPLTAYDPRFLRLLDLGPFERRERGGWRFGTKTISDVVVARLIESGRARRDGNRLLPASKSFVANKVWTRSLRQLAQAREAGAAR